MKAVKRKSVGTHFSVCVQPAFLVGTNNADGSPNFAPITWVSATNEKDDEYLLTVSMFGTRRTKQNVIRTGLLSVNLVSTELELMDYLGTHHGADGRKDTIPYGVCRGEAVDVPVLEASRRVYECEVAQAVETGDSTTFFCRIRNVQIDGRLSCADTFDIDLTMLEPVIYSGMYHSIGKQFGKIGDFAQPPRTLG